MDPIKRILAGLRTRATEILTELEAMRSELVDDDGNDIEPTDEQLARMDTLLAESETVAGDIADNERRLARHKAIEEAAARGRTEPGAPVAPRTPAAPTDDLDATVYRAATGNRDAQRDLTRRAVQTITDHLDISDARKDAALKALREHDRRGRLAVHAVLTESDAYRSAFAKLMVGEDWNLTDEERSAVAAVRAMSVGTDASGGFAVPFTLDPTIILTSDGAVNPLRAIASVRTTVTDNWEGVSSGGVTASYDAEAAEVSDDAPTLANPTIAIHMARAFVPYSIEAGMDIANLEEDVTVQFRDAKDTLEATVFTTGSGTGQPWGVVTAVAAVTASRVSATTNNAYGAVDVYAVQNGLAARHQPRASWLANLAVINLTRQFGTAFNHAFTADLTAGAPPQLLGKPLYEASAMDGAIATGNDDVLLYGDFQKYRIVDRVGMNIEYIPHLFATNNNRPSGQRGWFAYWRNGANVLDANAFRVLRV